MVAPKYSIFPDAAVPFTLPSEAVSMFIADYLDLVPGMQSRLIAAKGLSNVKLVACAIRQNRGKEIMSIYKFVLDSQNGTVYVLVINEADANMMAGRSWTVGGQLISLYRVLSITLRAKADDWYRTVDSDLLFPPNSQPAITL